MKKILLFVFLVVVMVVIFGCSTNTINPKRIKEDLTIKFSDENLVVEDVSIDLAKNDNKSQAIFVTLKMKSNIAILMRKYELLYEYYDVGGWILDDCIPVEQDQWTANLFTSPTISDETICDILFKKSNIGGYYINNSIEGTHFTSWTSGSGLDLPSTNYLTGRQEQVEFLEQAPQTTITVDCSTFTDELTINEVFKLYFELDVVSLEWIFKSGKSIQYDYCFSSEVLGRYVDDDSGDTINVTGTENQLFVSGIFYYDNKINWSFDDVEIDITGLFSVSINIQRNNQREHYVIDFYLEPVYLRFRSGVYNERFDKQ